MKLRVLARGSAMVPDIDALDAGIRRFVGRRLDPMKGEKYKDAEGVARQQGGFVPLTEPVEVKAHAEYVKAVRKGDLWAADEETAKHCAVTFDPSFGEPKTDKKGAGK